MLAGHGSDAEDVFGHGVVVSALVLVAATWRSLGWGAFVCESYTFGFSVFLRKVWFIAFGSCVQ